MARTQQRYQRVLRVGIAVIALSAITASAEALYGLALRAGYGQVTAASLPVALDVMAAVAAVAWLAPVAGPREKRYARGLCLVAVALAIAGNSGYKAMELYTVATPWWAVVSVAPAVLVAAVHLAVLLMARPGETVSASSARSAEEAPASVTVTGRSASSPATLPREREHAAVSTRDGQRDREPASVSASACQGASARASSKREVMRQAFDRAVQEDRVEELTGAGLARAADAHPSAGRRYLTGGSASMPS